MKLDLKLARMGMNMEEGTIAKWHKQPGESFTKGEVLYEVETEKSTQEVETTAAGKVIELYCKEGDVVPVGAVICKLEVDV